MGRYDTKGKAQFDDWQQSLFRALHPQEKKKGIPKWNPLLPFALQQD
jgi:hypothetical protein